MQDIESSIELPLIVANDASQWNSELVHHAELLYPSSSSEMHVAAAPASDVELLSVQPIAAELNIDDENELAVEHAESESSFSDAQLALTQVELSNLQAFVLRHPVDPGFSAADSVELADFDSHEPTSLLSAAPNVNECYIAAPSRAVSIAPGFAPSGVVEPVVTSPVSASSSASVASRPAFNPKSLFLYHPPGESSNPPATLISTSSLSSITPGSASVYTAPPQRTSIPSIEPLPASFTLGPSNIRPMFGSVFNSPLYHPAAAANQSSHSRFARSATNQTTSSNRSGSSKGKNRGPRLPYRALKPIERELYAAPKQEYP
jgi:hypothetical protein